MDGGAGRPSGARGVALLVAAALVAAGLLVVAPPARAEPLPDDPIIYLEPDCVPQPGTYSITVRGRNFDRNRKVIVSNFESDFNKPASETTATTNNFGLFTATLTVTADLYSYYNRITAGYDQGQVEATFYILGCRTTDITINPRCVPAGQATPITVDGVGFDSAGGAIVITVYDWNTGQQHFAMERPAASSFSQTLNLPALPNGEYRVEATQSTQSGLRSAREWLLAPCPTVTIEPACVAAGSPPQTVSILISGSGFVRGHGPEGEGSVDIIYDPNGQPQEFFYRLPNFGQLGPGGTFGPVEITPYARPSGTYAIAIVQRDDDRTVVSRVTARISAPCPATPSPTPTASPTPPLNATLEIDPDCGPPQIIDDTPQKYSVELVGRGFAPLTAVSVTFDADGILVPTQPPETFSTTTGQDGGFTFTIDPAYRPPGSFRIAAMQQLQIGTVEASAIFAVPCAPTTPTLTLDPTCGPAARGQPQAYSITVTGGGFAPGRVEVIFDPLVAPESTTTVADANGAFTLVLTPNGRAPGLYGVVARQAVASGTFAEASAQFVVTCDGVQLRITPKTGPRGFLPRVVGANFPPLTPLELYWNRGIDADRPIAVTTDENGSFARSVMIYRSDFLGRRRLTVVNPADPAAYVEVYVDYEVVLQPMAPPFATNPFGDSTMVSR